MIHSRGATLTTATRIGFVDDDAVVVPARLEWPTGPDAVFVWRFRDAASSYQLPWPADVGPARRFSYLKIEASADQALLAVVANGSVGGELTVFSVASGQVRFRIRSDQRLFFNDFRFSHNGARAAIALQSPNGADHPDRVMVLTSSLELGRVIPSPSPAVVSVAFSGDDRYLVTGGIGQWERQAPRISRTTRGQLEDPDALRSDLPANPAPIQIWDVATGQQVGNVDAPDTGVHELDWSRDNRLIAAVLPDHSVTVWEWPARTIALRVIPAAGAAPGLCARFSPDGRMLAICSRGTLLLLGID